MSNLLDLVPALKRTISVPGGFDALFPDVDDHELLGLIADSIAEAQLDGFLHEHEVALDTDAQPIVAEVTPALSNGMAINAAGAMVLSYALYRVVIAELRNVENRVNYVAGAARYEVERTASMLNEILRQLKARKDEFLTRARQAQMANVNTWVGDLTFVKATQDWRVAPQVMAFRYNTIFGG